MQLSQRRVARLQLQACLSPHLSSHPIRADQVRMSGARSDPVVAMRWLNADSTAVQWGLLVAVSGLLSLGWMEFGLPAGLLLGPMIAGIALAVRGARLTVPHWPYVGAQAIIGTMVASAITPQILSTLGHQQFSSGSSLPRPCLLRQDWVGSLLAWASCLALRRSMEHRLARPARWYC